MEMLRSLRGDKHEFCLTVIKSKHVHSCPSFDSRKQDRQQRKIDANLKAYCFINSSTIYMMRL